MASGYLGYGLSMESGMGGAGVATHADLDRLLDAALRLGKAHLARASEFEPDAIALGKDGRVVEIVQDRSALGKHPEPADVIENALQHLRQIRHQARGVALVINTRISKERTDAIEIRLEHSDGTALVVLQRYKRSRLGNRIDYGQMSVFTSPRDVWR
ncbi:MAG: hypothetical protein ACOH19_12835 [Rhodoglobus sp.]